jgi:hypothetical protein
LAPGFYFYWLKIDPSARQFLDKACFIIVSFFEVARQIDCLLAPINTVSAKQHEPC